jgi:hypothetical protein
VPLTGDLYKPVRGRRFDCILAHPPYVPTFSSTAIYRDGGTKGDTVIRQIAKGLARYLNPEGRFYILCLGMDTASQPFEDRFRKWLGSSRQDLDIIFARFDGRTPKQFARSLVSKVAGSHPDDFGRWMHLFEEWEVKEFVYGALVGKRLSSPESELQTRRVRWTKRCSPEGFDWLFEWFDRKRSPDFVEQLLSQSLQLPEQIQLEVKHTSKGGEFVPNEFHVLNHRQPFPTEIQTEAWVISLIARANQHNSAKGLFKEATAKGFLPPDFGREAFCQLLCFLIERGLLLSPLAPESKTQHR